MKKYLICDLDGCLIDSSWIWQVNKTLKLVPPQCWEYFEQNANASWNKIDDVLLDYLKEHIESGTKILFLTARSTNIKDETIGFIQSRTGLVHYVDFDCEFRSPEDDSSPADYKSRVIDKYIKAGATFEIAIDDDKSVVDMYKNKGINAVRWQIGFLPLDFIDDFDVKTLTDDDLYNLFEDLINEMNKRKAEEQKQNG